MQYQTLHSTHLSKCKLPSQCLYIALLAFVLIPGFLTGCARYTLEQQGILDKYANYPYADWYTENKACIFVDTVSNEILSDPKSAARSGAAESAAYDAMKAKGLKNATVFYSTQFRPGVKLGHIEGEYFSEHLLRIRHPDYGSGEELPKKKLAEKLLQDDNYADSFGKKFYVLNAETLENIPVVVSRWVTNAVMPEVGFSKSFYNGFVIAFDVNTPEVKKARFLLVCFEGISKDEFQELETVPLFYIVDLKQGSRRIGNRILDLYPRRLGDLVNKRVAAKTAPPAVVEPGPKPREK